MARKKPLVVDLDWAGFQQRLTRYAGLTVERRSELLFRGQSDSKWSLVTTLDREVQDIAEEVREDFIAKSLAEFQSELVGLADEGRTYPEGDAGELLARHYGLPSPLMDWTQSPYIAAFFAFATAKSPSGEVAIWRLDRSRVTFDTRFDLIDDRALLRFNKRALRQRSVFLRVNQQNPPVEDLLAPALIKYRLPFASRRQAMAELDEMGINATMLFGDIEGAAKTAWSRSAQWIGHPHDA